MTHDLGILLIRVIIGLGIAVHGSQKLFGWFGGPGIKGTSAWMESMGFRPGALFATAAGCGEFVGGLLILLGFLGPVGPALVIATMTVAILTVHIRNGFLAANNGFEMPLLYIAGALTAAFTSSSTLTLDTLLGIQFLHSELAIWAFVAIGVVAGLANLLARRSPRGASA